MIRNKVRKPLGRTCHRQVTAIPPMHPRCVPNFRCCAEEDDKWLDCGEFNQRKHWNANTWPDPEMWRAWACSAWGDQSRTLIRMWHEKCLRELLPSNATWKWNRSVSCEAKPRMSWHIVCSRTIITWALDWVPNVSTSAKVNYIVQNVRLPTTTTESSSIKSETETTTLTLRRSLLISVSCFYIPIYSLDELSNLMTTAKFRRTKYDNASQPLSDLLYHRPNRKWRKRWFYYYQRITYDVYLHIVGLTPISEK